MPITLVTKVPGGIVRSVDLNAINAPLLMLTTAVYNVTESTFGAIGDGATDDSTAINAAITAANTAGGGVVLIPEGTFIVQNITQKSNVILRGVGKSSILKLKNSTTADVIKSFGTSDGTKITFAGIENLTIDGNKANQSNGVDLQQYGISLLFATDCWVDRVWVKDTQRSGIYMSGSRNRITNSHGSGIGKLGAASSRIGRSGFVLDSDGTNPPKGSLIDNNTLTDCLEHAIKIYPGGHNSAITNNYVLAAEDRGIYLQGVNYAVVSNNRIDGASVVGIFIGDGTDAGIGNVVSGNTVNGILVGTSGGHGILVQNQTGVEVTGNSVTGCYGNGIYILTVTGFTATGNRCHGNGTNGAGGAITCYQSQHGAISGNMCSNQGTTGSRGYGIWTWDAGTACLNIVISGNRCYDSAAGASKKQSYGVLTANISNYITLSGNDLGDNFTGTYSMVGANNTVMEKARVSKTFGPFFANDLLANATRTLAQGYFNTTTALSLDTANLIKVGAACKVVGLTLISDADRTAGTATLYVNGGSVNATSCVLNATNVDSKDVVCAHDLGVSIASGGTITLTVDADASWAPITANVRAFVTVSYD